MFSKLINRQRLNALARREQSRVIPPDVQEVGLYNTGNGPND